MTSTSAVREPPIRRRGVFDRLFEPVDIASLVMFRVAFGLILAWQALQYVMPYRGTSQPSVLTNYIAPQFLFKYYGFEWVQPWAGNGMVWHVVALAAVALAFAAGLCYRISAVLLFVGYTHLFLLDQGRYLNHMYLVSLLCFLMIFVPANREMSLDASRRPALRSTAAPAWALWILRFQLGIVYFFAGVAKLNPDWLAGEPMRQWMRESAGIPVLGLLLTHEPVVYLFSYGAMFFDLLVFPALLWRRTRLAAFGVTVVFHLLNACMFDIGIFPWLGIAATTLFLDPSWPRKMPGGGGAVTLDGPEPTAVHPRAAVARAVVLAGLSAYVALQLALPLRHLLYPGDVDWTYEGHRFAWRMKLHDREARARFTVTDTASGQTWSVDPADYLTERQLSKMGARPDMILQFAHFIAERHRQPGYANVTVTADIMLSLNGREPQRLIDPGVNLAAEPRTLRAVDWILQPDLPPVDRRFHGVTRDME